MKKEYLINELSVIIPAFNAEKTMEKCLKGVFKQNYLPNKFEVVVVNDGSKDETEEIAGKFPVELINFSRNKGRITARIIGVKKAKYKYLLFLDADCEPGPTWIIEMLKYNYQPVQAQVFNLSNSMEDRLLYLIRKRYYKTLNDATFMTKENFFRFPKGIGNFLCSKYLYNKVSFNRKDEFFSDDQYCIYEICKYKKILAIPSYVKHYNAKYSLRKVLKEIFQRGSRFADFYLRKNGLLTNKFYFLFFFTLFFSFLIFFFLGLKTFIFLFLLAFISLFIAVIFYLIEKPKDFFIVGVYFFPILITFALGVIYRKLLCEK